MGSSPTRGSSFFLGKVTALGVLCCFALFVCLTLFASFFLPSHLSFKNMYMYIQCSFILFYGCVLHLTAYCVCYCWCAKHITLSVNVSLNVQSSLEGEVERCDGELTGFVSLCKEILQRFVRDHFPTTSTTPANQV